MEVFCKWVMKEYNDSYDQVKYVPQGKLGPPTHPLVTTTSFSDAHFRDIMQNTRFHI